MAAALPFIGAAGTILGAVNGAKAAHSANQQMNAATDMTKFALGQAQQYQPVQDQMQGILQQILGMAPQVDAQGNPVGVQNNAAPSFMNIDWTKPYTPEQLGVISQGNLQNAADLTSAGNANSYADLLKRGLIGQGMTSSADANAGFRNELYGRQARNQGNLATIGAVTQRGDQLRGEQNANWQNLVNIVRNNASQQLAPWANIASNNANTLGQQSSNIFSGIGNALGTLYGNKTATPPVTQLPPYYTPPFNPNITSNGMPGGQDTSLGSYQVGGGNNNQFAWPQLGGGNNTPKVF